MKLLIILMAITILNQWMPVNDAHANVVGSDASIFSPTADGLDFVTVQSADTLAPGVVNLGFFLNHAANTFPAFRTNEGGIEQSTTDVNDTLLSADFSIAVGLTQNFQAFLSLPFILNQSVDASEGLGQFENQGLTDIRLGGKYKFDTGSDFNLATILSINFNQIKNNPFIGNDGGPIYNLEFAVDKDLGAYNWAFNIGHRWRNPGTVIDEEIGIDPIPNQFIFSTAFSYLFTDYDTKLIAELVASIPSDDSANSTDRELSTYEFIVGAKHDLSNQTALHFGAGTELAHGTSTPDWRVYAGINIALGPLWGQKEQVRLAPIPIKEDPPPLQIIVLSNLKFKFNSSELSASSKAELKNVAREINATKNVKKIVIGGHTDSIGAEDYNIELSEKRAESVKNYLKPFVKLKLDDFISIGHGEKYPIANNGNFQGRAKNRRVVIKTYKQ